MLKEQKELLDELYHQYGNFRVASHNQYGWYYHKYPSKEAIKLLKNDELTDRDIMKDEIVIESDLPMRKMNMGVSLKHEKKLRNNGIGYEKWFSGNKSYHIQLKFEELNLIQDLSDLKLLKKSMLLWLYSFNHIDLSRHHIDVQLTGKHLIRLEHSRHTITGQRKTLYTEHIVDDNKLPTIVWLYYFKEKNKTYNIISSSISVFDRPCIMYLYRTILTDGRQRAAFILFNNFKIEFGIDKASKMLIEWNKNNNNHIPIHELLYMIKYHSYDNKHPGCKYIQDFIMSINKKSVCDNCPCIRGVKS